MQAQMTILLLIPILFLSVRTDAERERESKCCVCVGGFACGLNINELLPPNRHWPECTFSHVTMHSGHWTSSCTFSPASISQLNHSKITTTAMDVGSHRSTALSLDFFFFS